MSNEDVAVTSSFPRSALVAALALICAGTASAGTLNGQVLGAGAPIANSTVTLWGASAGAPKELAQVRSGANGRFTMTFADAAAAGTSLYLVALRGQTTANKAGGDNSRIALMTVLGADWRGKALLETGEQQ